MSNQKMHLHFVNDSTNKGDVCVFQSDPNLGVKNVFSLAWFTKATEPTTKVKFTWEILYNFVWCETGVLQPGVKFDASQAWPANLQTNNKVTFTRPQNAYTFKDQMKGEPTGSLIIQQDNTIPLKQASVGIGMSGQGTFAVQAQPRLKLTFSPKPKYWIAFGTYEEGQVLDIQQITDKAEIVYDPGIYSMTAILNNDNSWTIKPTKEINAAFLSAREQDPAARWGEAA